MRRQLPISLFPKRGSGFFAQAYMCKNVEMKSCYCCGPEGRVAFAIEALSRDAVLEGYGGARYTSRFNNGNRRAIREKVVNQPKSTSLSPSKPENHPQKTRQEQPCQACPLFPKNPSQFRQLRDWLPQRGNRTLPC